MKIILLGSPGVGKGTYTKSLSEKYKIPHISTGDISRDISKDDSELGRSFKKYVDKGMFVPNDLIFKVLKERLNKYDCVKGFFLDGFPRNVEQAEMLNKIFKIDKVINFDAKENVIIKRLSGRLVCKNCGGIYHKIEIKPKKEGVCDKCNGKLYQREDDKKSVVKKRLEIYNRKTKPLIKYYKENGLLVNINCNKGYNKIKEIINECCKVLDKFI